METYDDIKYSDITTFRIGGLITELVYPETIKEALEAYDGCDIIGNGSNILASDNTHGKVICTELLNGIRTCEDGVVFECGVHNKNAVSYCLHTGIGGLEFLTGIPGTIGGAVVTNAGFYGNEMSDFVVWVNAIVDGEIVTIPRDDIVFARRYCSLKDDNIFVLEVCLDLPVCDRKDSRAKIIEYNKVRRKNQTHRHPSAGGVFKNYKLLIGKIPDNTITCGGARLYVDQPNFIFNIGNATFDDVESIINYVTSIEPRLILEIDIKRGDVKHEE